MLGERLNGVQVATDEPRIEQLSDIEALARPSRRERVLEVASLLSPLLILALWEFLSRSGAIDARFFPPPSAIIGTFWEQLASGALFRHVSATLSRVVIGFAMGVVPGVILGLTLGLFRPVRMVVAPIIAALYPVPKIAILPLVLLIFGLGDTSKHVIIAIGVFFLVFYNTMGGVLQIPQIYLDVAHNVGASRLQVYRLVALPAALPMIFTGLRLASGTSFIIIAAAEFVGAKSGIGWMIWTSWQVFAVGRMYVGIVVLALLGYLASLVIDRVEKWVIPWAAR